MRCDFVVSLSVSGGQTETDGDDSTNNGNIQKSDEQSHTLLTVEGSDPQSSISTVRSASPTFHAVHDVDSGTSSGTNQSATCQPLKEGEEIRYHGYTNPHKQSRSFQMLEQGLRMAELGQGVFFMHTIKHTQYCYNYCCCVCLQCFDAVGWAAGRASGL